MSLQFVFGNSGSGKSDYLYEKVLAEAAENPDKNFLVLVPEQFTMQTQRELVKRQKNHAIMNVDVLSFARLAYRVFDELGKQELVVLEETGKNLVLRKVAEQKKNELHILGGNINKMGYIGEIKSLISELSQYNVTPEDLEDFLQEESIGQSLQLKMQDVLTIYQGFREYMEGKYITSEEVLTLLCDVAENSAILADSVIVFDEFTGFTPVQNRLLQKLLTIADKIVVSLSMDSREDFYHSRGVHELFSMSKKTVEVLLKMAVEIPVEVEDAIVLSPGKEKRFKNAKDLFFMEQNLFRPFAKKWTKEVKNIHMAGLKNPREELIFTAKEITRLIREHGYCYKDIAVVTGDVPQYANYVPEIFEQYKIPYFIDQTTNILFHPFIEFIRATLEVVEYDFSYESVFRFLRTGLASPMLGEAPEEAIDALENYVLAKGIRGKKRWSKEWTFVMPRSGDAETIKLDMLHMNKIRQQIYQAFVPLVDVFKGKTHMVKEQTYELYRFITALLLEEQLKQKEDEFEAEGELAKAREYAQIYKIVMDLLDKVSALLGEEKIDIREYGDILDAGFSAAKVGVIPPGNDKVILGDIERTRLNHIKILFFVGVNDGVVPKGGTNGSIISQFEREKMAEHHLELAPGAREKVFIQKFYLYLNMTKPSDRLYVTYSAVGTDGKALRKSYLIGTLLKLFPKMQIQELDETQRPEDVMTPESAVRFFIEGLQQKTIKDETWKALANWYLTNEPYSKKAKQLLAAAFLTHTDEPISHAVTRALYGTVLENSVTRLERFAACAFAHFMDYGLQLQERELQQFATVDMGNIYHDALEHFAKKVTESEYTWDNMPQKIQETWIEESTTEALLECSNPDIFEDARNAYLLERMKQTLRKTVWALTTQVQKGKFVPTEFEVSFSSASQLDAIQFQLSDEEKMRLRGRIDRVDTYETQDKVYVKIIDYKSGNTSFSLLNLYHGLQLQLVVYLNAAIELTKKNHKEKAVEPAGIFYYHIQDPMVDATGTESDAEIRQEVLKQLKLNGLVNDNPEVYRAMDTEFVGTSDVIPVALKVDGSLKANSKTASTTEFSTISQYVNQVLVKQGQEILNGNAAIAPYQMDNCTGCDYCPYHVVCGFDSRIPGFEYRTLEKIDSTETIIEKMQQKGQE